MVFESGHGIFAGQLGVKLREARGGSEIGVREADDLDPVEASESFNVDPRSPTATGYAKSRVCLIPPHLGPLCAGSCQLTLLHGGESISHAGGLDHDSKL